MLSLLAILAGCGSVFQGTWLFSVDRNSTYSGDCADDGDTGGGSTITYTGMDNMWVDIYDASGGQVVVLLDEALVGTPEGTSLRATWEQSVTSDTQTQTEQYDLSAELDGDTLGGTYSYHYATSGGDDPYTCDVAVNVSAVQNTSERDTFAGN